MKMRMKLACAATTCPTAWSSRSSRPSADPLSVSSNELRYFSIPAWPIFLADSSVFHLFVCWCLVPVWFFRAARICSTNFDFELGVAEACFLPCHVASETSLQGQQQRAAPSPSLPKIPMVSQSLGARENSSPLPRIYMPSRFHHPVSMRMRFLPPSLSRTRLLSTESTRGIDFSTPVSMRLRTSGG